MILSTTVRSLVTRLRSLVRNLWVYALHMSGALARAKSRIRADEGAVVLTLHRVLPDRERGTTLSPPGMVMSEQTFASMVRYLAAEHRVFPLDAPQKSVRTDQRIAIAITFDDGWVDNARYAQRILARHAMPAAIFLCPEEMGKSLPFWPERLVAFFRAATRLRREKEFLDVIRECAHLPESKVIAQADELVEVIKEFSARRRNLLFERLEQLGFGKNLGNSLDTDSTMSWVPFGFAHAPSRNSHSNPTGGDLRRDHRVAQTIEPGNRTALLRFRVSQWRLVPRDSRTHCFCRLCHGIRE
jgi:hypothetical protein